VNAIHVATHGVGGSEWPGYGGFGWPGLGLGLVWLVVALLFWVGLITLLVWAVRSASAPSRGPDTAMQVLKRRLASSEITQEEYDHIRRLLDD
jgi:uncharacterized membrane protein